VAAQRAPSARARLDSWPACCRPAIDAPG